MVFSAGRSVCPDVRAVRLFAVLATLALGPAMPATLQAQSPDTVVVVPVTNLSRQAADEPRGIRQDLVSVPLLRQNRGRIEDRRPENGRWRGSVGEQGDPS